MRASVKNSVALISPQGFLDANSIDALFNQEDIRHLASLNIEMLLVSLKKVIFFNKNGLGAYLRLFEAVRQKKNIAVGFCDYDKKKFDTILKYYDENISFSLFKTVEMAYLFTPNFANKSNNVLVYSEDRSQTTAIAIELHDNGHNPIVAKNYNDFLEKKASFEDSVELTFLGSIGQKIATRVSGNAIIYTISSYLDTEIAESFNDEYHINSLNVGFRLFIFDASKVISMNTQALNFFSKLSTSAAEYNATICFSGMSFLKTPMSFKETLEDAGVMFFEKMDDILLNKDLLKELGAGGATNAKIKRTINKENILRLPDFIEATISTLEMMSNAKAVKKYAAVDKLRVADKSDKLASSIGYYGAIDGMVVLIFPSSIAKKACELLIGEDTDDVDMILDTLAELVNIVGGSIKTLLSKHNIAVNITLPRTYQDIDDLLSTIGERKGVQVELEFNGDSFLFFLTR